MKHWFQMFVSHGGRSMLRAGLRRSVGIVFGLMLGGGVLAQIAWSAPASPNIIFILADDLGYGDIGCFGNTILRTPNLDRMAQEGMKLTSFYAAPCCSPARAGFMTGCYARRVGLNNAPSGFWVLLPRESIGINPAETTVAEVLHGRGYATMCIGKWHLGDQLPFLPTRNGFDEFYGLPYSNDMWPPFTELNDPKSEELRKLFNHPPLPLLRGEKVLRAVEDQSVLTADYTREAVAFIRRNKNRPFFLYFPHTAVHVPHYPGKAFLGKSPIGRYGDWIEELDWSVGEVLRTVRELGLDHNTLVVFSSDNGGVVRFGASNGPLRGGKGSVFEGGVRVPFIARWPGRIPAGKSRDEPGGLIDLLPTFAACAGARLSADHIIDGRNLEPLLSGKPDAQPPHDVMLFYEKTAIGALRAGKWKLFVKGGQLYDLDQDIGEKTNVAKAHPEVVAKLQGYVRDALDDLGDDSGEHPGHHARPPGHVDRPQFILNRDGTCNLP